MEGGTSSWCSCIPFLVCTESTRQAQDVELEKAVAVLPQFFLLLSSAREEGGKSILQPSAVTVVLDNKKGYNYFLNETNLKYKTYRQEIPPKSRDQCLIQF